MVGDRALSGADTIIDFQDVALQLGGERIYDRLSFSVRAGEFFCILGPSGCGKSTSLRLIGDLLRATHGVIRVNGRAPAEAWSDVAFVFQSPRLVPWRSALGNVMLGSDLRLGKQDRHKREARAQELLSLVGLARDADKMPIMLSGGERQRVAIARALMVDPKIILMDEPFSALDPNTRTRMRLEIVELWRATGKTIVFVTHDIDEALMLADRLILLSSKPTHVLEEIAIDVPRPRAIEQDATLSAMRVRLVSLFRSLEPGAQTM